MYKRQVQWTRGGADAAHLSYGSDPSQHAQLALAATDAPAPVCVVIHGGFWRARYGLDLGAPLANDLAAHGIAALNVEYRRVGAGGGWPQSGADVAAALDALAEAPPEGANPLDLTGAVINDLALFTRCMDAMQRDPAVSVLVCVADDDVETYADIRLRSNRVNMARVRFVTVAYDDTWLRDSGPITLRAGNGFNLLDFRFTAWGGKFEAGLDDLLVETLAAQGVFGDAARQRIDFALEGGGIETDGHGTLLTTWRCLHERHPDASREEPVSYTHLTLPTSDLV